MEVAACEPPRERKEARDYLLAGAQVSVTVAAQEPLVFGTPASRRAFLTRDPSWVFNRD